MGTALSDLLIGTKEADQITGYAGDDTVNGAGGNDLLFGDYHASNLVEVPDGATGFADYAASEAWQITDLTAGHQQMMQTLSTEVGGVYHIDLSLAANFAGGRSGAAIEVFADDTLLGRFETDSGAFQVFQAQFTAQTTVTDLTIRSVATEEDDIDTSGPIFHRPAQIEINGEEITVAAFADGQANLYQVLNGTLHVYDTSTGTYHRAGATGTVNVNSMGYNAQDDLLYAIAVSNGVDSLGNSVSRSDLVMLDALGQSYRIGETPYRSWTGDFDDQGNLWSFQSSMNHIAVIDVDQRDEAGNPAVEVHRLPRDLVGINVYDVAFDPLQQSFFGVARPPYEGAQTVLLKVDISTGTPQFSEIMVTQTVVDGVTHAGAPAMTFGAAIIDADGTLFVGGNAGDHDMNNATRASGGIYRVDIDPDSGTATLILQAQAPKSYSNDGAGDPTALSPFADVDLSSSVLIRDISLQATTEGDLSYNDSLSGNSGQDDLRGGIGEDILKGGSLGDALQGDSGADQLFGGAGSSDGVQSFYDANGARFDALGQALAPDDDTLSGGAGHDLLSGDAGHDLLHGDAGRDTLKGGSGSDTIWGGDNADVLYGGSQADALYGDTGADTLSGGSGDDTLTGGADTDELNGGSGNDALSGGLGDDTLLGGSGDDLLAGDAGADQLKGGSGNDTLEGGAEDDALNGGSGHDVLTGGEGRDYLNGSSGNDTLDGGAGRDRIYMGAGDDLAYGGADADRFVFRTQDLDGSQDVIADFSVSEGDRLDLRAFGLSQSDLLQMLSVSDQDVLIALDHETELILRDAAHDYAGLTDNILI
jgi:Ca2+-binding RTX toxin-like protein